MDYIDDAARRSTRYSEGNYVSLGWLSWLIPAAVIVDYVVGNPSFDTFLIRLSAAFVGIPAIFYRNLSPSLLKYFHIYFVIGAAYCFPFTYGLMLSMNAATTPPDSQLHMIWIIQYIIALFLFIQIVVDNALASVLWVLSCVLVLLPIPLLPVINTDELVRVLVYPITGYLTALGIGLVTNRKSAIVDSEKASAAAAIGANLAHASCQHWHHRKGGNESPAGPYKCV
jgi:hypothetical protein